MGQKSTKFRILKIISTLVVVLAVTFIGYMGYDFYKKQEIPNKQKISTQSQSTTSEATQDTQEAQIDWANMLNSLQENTKPTKESKPQIKKPYLAIIMDDIAYSNQLKDIQSLNLPITPSFFPVSEDSPQTAKMAKEVPFYMVHLPLEAQNTQISKHYWIKSHSTLESIRAQIAKIKQDFPKLAFINNHTGSKFSANYNDMLKLLYVLESFGIDFVDSRTTPHTTAPEIYKKSTRPLLYRDIFLDNKQNQDYIHKQIERAIAIAKEKGYAIAIAHPHSVTFKALKEARDMLLREVELVYIKDLPIAKNRPQLKISMQDIIDSARPVPKITPDTAKSHNLMGVSSFETKKQKKDKTTQIKQSPKEITDCKQDEVEAFISGCPELPKTSAGFIDLHWERQSDDNQPKVSPSSKQKIRDFIEMDGDE